MELQERLFVMGVRELESLVKGDLELTATVPWLRAVADKIARHETTKIKHLATDYQRRKWAVEQAAEWMPWPKSDVAELVAVCAEWRVWEMDDIEHTEGRFDKIAYIYVREVVWRVLFAMAEEVQPSVP